MSVKVQYLEVLYGLMGVREKFEDMVVQLIRTEHPSVARVRVFRGDGGIDAHDGNLSDPTGVDVFQIKYFQHRIEKSQKDQIREAFNRVRDNDAFVTKSWTLCLSLDMSTDEKKWFEEWKAKQADSGIVIHPVWGATEIEGLLMKEANRGIRESFFQQEHLQVAREMSSHLRQIREEIVDRIPKPERITLVPKLEVLSVKDVEAASEYEAAAYIVVKARFRVTNTSVTKPARVWDINIELTPPSDTLAQRYKTYPHDSSHNVVLPTKEAVTNVEFGFRVTQDWHPLAIQLGQGLYLTVIRFQTVSEDGVGDWHSASFSEVADGNHFLDCTRNMLRNKLSWRQVV